MAYGFEGPFYCHLGVNSQTYHSVSTVVSVYRMEPEVGGVSFYGF